MKKIKVFGIIASLALLANIAFSGGVMRIVLPTIADLVGYPTVEGELAYDETNELLKVFRGGTFNILRSILPENSELSASPDVDGELSIDVATGLVNVASGGLRSKLRTSLKDVAELEAINPLDGELAYDSSTGEVLVRHQGTFIKPNIYVEKLPMIYGDGDRIDVSPGKIVINNNYYVNAATTSCSFTATGLGGVDVGSDFSDVNFAYVYLIPSGSGFGCILSSKHDGPISSFEGWKRVASPMVGFNDASVQRFKSLNGEILHSWNSPMISPVAGGCQEWDLSNNIPPSAISVTISVQSIPGSFDAVFYSSSTCTGFSMNIAGLPDYAQFEMPIQDTGKLYYIYTSGTLFPSIFIIKESILDSEI